MSYSRPEDVQLLRYVSGESSPEERKIIDHWISEDETHEGFVAELQQIWNADWALPPEPFDDVAQKDWAALHERLRRERPDDRKPLSRTRERDRSRRRQVHFIRLSVGATMAVIVLVVGLVLTITAKNEMPPADEPALRTIAAEPGQRLTITLSDGTLIELNSDSRLMLPERFDPDERVVQLEGEAFFDVAGSERPFRVVTPDAFVRVLGTSFGVRAYPDENVVELGVSEGSVALAPASAATEEMLLEAGDAAFVDRVRQEAATANMDMSVFLAWRQGQVAYQDAGLEHVARDLARRYDTDVAIDVPNPSAYSVTARLQARHLDDVVAAITVPLGLRYELTEEGVRIFE